MSYQDGQKLIQGWQNAHQSQQESAMRESKALTKTEQALQTAISTSQYHQHRVKDLEQQLHTMAKEKADLAALKSKLLAQGSLTKVIRFVTLHAA